MAPKKKILGNCLPPTISEHGWIYTDTEPSLCWLQRNPDVNGCLTTVFLSLSSFASSEGISAERGGSGAATTRKEEGEEEKECKAAAPHPGAEFGACPRPGGYHGPDGGHPRPAAAKRASAGPDGEASEDRYPN